MKPKSLLRFTQYIIPWSLVGCILLTLVGLYLSLIVSPADYQQGDAVRIMYVHVPSAWMSLSIYTSMALSALVSLVWKYPLGTLYARAAAPVGAVFTALCLITGSLWGTPMWGTWWVWDARLTSVLILFFMYIGYILLTHAFDNPQHGDWIGNVLLLIGVVNLPIIKFSVDWWNTLHQSASVLRLDGPTIHPSMLLPLSIMVLAFLTYTVTVIALRLHAVILSRRIRTLRYKTTYKLTQL